MDPSARSAWNLRGCMPWDASQGVEASVVDHDDTQAQANALDHPEVAAHLSEQLRSILRRIDGGNLPGRRVGVRGRHPVRHLRHQGAEDDHHGREDHDITHHATLAEETRDITTSTAKPRLTVATKAGISVKRMSEVLTGKASF